MLTIFFYFCDSLSPHSGLVGGRLC